MNLQIETRPLKGCELVILGLEQKDVKVCRATSNLIAEG